MAISSTHHGAETVGQRTVTGRSAFIEAKKPAVPGTFYNRCAVTGGVAIRKGRPQYTNPRNVVS